MVILAICGVLTFNAKMFVSFVKKPWWEHLIFFFISFYKCIYLRTCPYVRVINSQVPHCEPLTTLQRLTEELEYSNLLDKAVDAKSDIEEMAYVAAFSISVYSSSVNRDGKPFNPIFGETYECDRREDKGWRSIAEQVSDVFLIWLWFTDIMFISKLWRR